MNGRPASPLYAGVNITSTCNLSCVYCYMQPLTEQLMTRDDFELVLGELRAASAFLVCIAGGEPFLHPQVSEFLELSTRTLPHTVVITNGTAFTAEHFAMLDTLVARRRRLSVQVSIDSVDPAVNLLTRSRPTGILRNLAKLRDIGVRLTIAMVVTRHNRGSVLESIADLSQFTRYFHLMSVQAPRLAPRSTDSLDVEPAELSALWDAVHDLAAERDLYVSSPRTVQGGGGSACGAPCSAAFSRVVIDPNLDVRPCDQLTDLVLGNLRQDSLHSIWTASPTIPVLHGSPVPYCRRPAADPGERPLVAAGAKTA